mmetsp:Transcript_5557/g.12169  ORF Transcript_5557/g.12169 Transcript_5557/m.12169 type:complete len:366 (+) Transcript_5557:124-1221(+)
MSAGRRIRLVGSIAASRFALAAAWGGSSESTNAGMYYQNEAYDWLYSSSNIAMKVEGCVWATTDDNEDVGCMEDESGDGTTYWYQMAMCRRAQVAYSVYASDSGSASCSSSSFKGTFVTQDGLAEFAYLMETYDGYSPITQDSVGDVPMCEEGGNNGYYLSVGCASDGTFTIDEFSDQYCLQRVGTYSYLSDVNSIFKSYFQSCYGIYSAKTDESVDYSAAGALVSASKACGALDSYLCQDNERISSASSGKISTISSAGHTIANFNVANKAKYALGTLCLIGSLFMFLGILFTNRRKRRAMMHRKMRASRSKRGSSKKRSSSRHKASSSRSKSRTRGDSSRTSRSRSKSRARSSSKRVDEGVFA